MDHNHFIHYLSGVKTLYKDDKKPKQEKCWDQLARDNQKEPKGNWNTWLILAGRGFGKTRTGAETIQKWVRQGKAKNIALVGQTDGDVEKVMIQGPSGIQAIAEDSLRPRYYKAQKKLVWPNGAYALVISDSAYERLRGPQFDAAWIDELAKFTHVQETWDQLGFALRLGKRPRCIVTTTPKPIALIRKLITQKDVYVTTGSTLDNAQNLAANFIENMLTSYHNTRLGRQEIYAEILGQHESQTWSENVIRACKRSVVPTGFLRTIVAVDPALSYDEQSDETGIIVASLCHDRLAWVRADYSCKRAPIDWVQRAIQAYKTYKADAILFESNNGGDVISNLFYTVDPKIKLLPARATQSKLSRSEPIAALYEQGRVFHVDYGLDNLEEQMILFPDAVEKSPDRVDALVWALNDLFFNKSASLRPTLWV